VTDFNLQSIEHRRGMVSAVVLARMPMIRPSALAWMLGVWEHESGLITRTKLTYAPVVVGHAVRPAPTYIPIWFREIRRTTGPWGRIQFGRFPNQRGSSAIWEAAAAHDSLLRGFSFGLNQRYMKFRPELDVYRYLRDVEIDWRNEVVYTLADVATAALFEAPPPSNSSLTRLPSFLKPQIGVRDDSVRIANEMRTMALRSMRYTSPEGAAVQLTAAAAHMPPISSPAGRNCNMCGHSCGRRRR